jgi:hypothetical protein
MNIEEARNLVFFEGSGPNGMVVATRLCDFPSLIRVHVLTEALEVIFEHYTEADQIERELAHSLFCIAFHIQANIEAASSSEIEIDPKFAEEILTVYMLVESIFKNKWLLDQE